MGNLIGGVLDTQAARQETGIAESQAGFNKQVAEKNAKLSLEQGEQQARDIREQTKRDVGSARAISAASGVITTEGSALLAQTKIAFEGEKEALTALRRSKLQAQGFETEADFRLFERDVAGERGKTKQKRSLLSGIAGGIKEGSTLFAASDRRLKIDIKLIGKSPSGLNIYEFRYKRNPKHLFEGVIAQELVGIKYEALKVNKEGFLIVDYSKIDVQFKQIK